MASDAEHDNMSVVLLIFGRRGGMAHYSALLANSLNDLVDLTVIAPESEEIQDMIDDTVSIYEYSSPGTGNPFIRSYRLSKTFLKIQFKISKLKPDVLHVPFIGPMKSTLILPFLRLHQSILAGTVHDPISHSKQSNQILGVDISTKIRALFSKSLSICFVHGSECEAQAIRAGYPKERLVSIPHGLYTHFQLSDSIEDSPKEDSKFDLLFFGRIRSNKGYERIPDIVDFVGENRDGLSVVIAGAVAYDSWSSSEISELLASLNDRPEIELRNRYIPNEEVENLFRQAKIVVLPYNDSTSSGVLMTAYTFNTPVVVTNTGEIGRMVSKDKTGLVSSTNSIQDIGRSINELLDNDHLRIQFSQNMEDAKNNYSWTAIARKTVEEYRKKLNSF